MQNMKAADKAPYPHKFPADISIPVGFSLPLWFLILKCFVLFVFLKCAPACSRPVAAAAAAAAHNTRSASSFTRARLQDFRVKFKDLPDGGHDESVTVSVAGRVWGARPCTRHLHAGRASAHTR